MGKLSFPPWSAVACALLLALALCGVSAHAQAAGTDGAVLIPLLQRVIERNALGDEVALSKWDSGRPVLDAEREAAVLRAVGAAASVQGLDPALAARFFAAQIEANKLVQYQLLQLWQALGRAPARARPDLAALRLRLDRLQGELLTALAASAPLRMQPGCAAQVAGAVDAQARRAHLDEVHRVALGRSFGDFCQ